MMGLIINSGRSHPLLDHVGVLIFLHINMDEAQMFKVNMFHSGMLSMMFEIFISA